jgi:hypothetical protein
LNSSISQTFARRSGVIIMVFVASIWPMIAKET